MWTTKRFHIGLTIPINYFKNSIDTVLVWVPKRMFYSLSSMYFYSNLCINSNEEYVYMYYVVTNFQLPYTSNKSVVFNT